MGNKYTINDCKSKRRRTAVRLYGGLLACMTVFLAGCAATTPGQQPISLPAEQMILGWTDRSFLDKPAFTTFKVSYDTALVQEDFVGLIQQLHGGAEWLVFFGTWCGDSRRELPKFLKILDRAGIPTDLVRLYGVDRSKRSGDGLAERYAIELVPTFILLRGGEETGRITETPRISMEADILSLLAAGR